MLLSMALDEFLTVRSVRLNERSLAQYEWELDRFVQFCTSQRVTDTSQLSAAVGAAYLNFLRGNGTARGTTLSSRSLLHYTKSLKCFFGWLVREELAPARVLRLELPAAERKIPPTLSAAQQKLLVQACQESDGPALQARDTALVLLLVDTGMRASEVCQLRIADVRLNDDPHVLVRYGKGNKWREVGPLGKRTVRALRAYVNTWRSRQHPKDGVDTFFINRYGKPMQPITLERLLERLKERTGLDARTNPHTFRHSWARTKAEQGSDVLTISRLLGHSALSTTSLYLGTFASADARKRETSVVDRGF